jgi:uncharacterized repeat protein (TIGR01451 family)
MIGNSETVRGAMRLASGTLFVVATAMAGASGTAAAKGVVNPAPAQAQTVFETITSAGPLSAIYLGVDAASQIDHTGDTPGEVYPPGTNPGDYGSFVVVDDALYAPDFENHGGTATGLGPYTVFTPISQSPIGGAGTSASPFTVTTVVGVGGTGLMLTQVDSYVVGQESYRTDVTLTNASASAVDAILYRAMDCYLGGSDHGFGLVNGTSVGCTTTPDNSPPDRIEELVPLSGGNNYYQSGYSEVWEAISTHLPFDNTCQCENDIDNGAGISWNVTIPAGGSITRSNLTVFSPLGSQALFVTKTADSASANAGGSDGYTITVTNPNAAASTLNSIIDTLPAGFSYALGSSSGATTTNPTIAGQVLTWTGPFTAPAGGTVSLHFGVTVASVNGTYTNQETADAGADTVAGTGPTAPVTVGAGPPPPPSGAAPLPTLSETMLAALIVLLLGAGVFAGRRARR